MNQPFLHLGLASSLLLSFTFSPLAWAAPKLRKQVDQRGDFVLLGNTLAQSCETGVIPPVKGTVGACGTDTSDSSPDVFWSADTPALGNATANTSISLAANRSTAVLSLPAGAKVTYARVYWSSESSNGAADTSITLERPSTFSQTVTADDSFTNSGNAYQSTADITQLVQTRGPGAYRVSGVNSKNPVNLNDSVYWSAWWIVVFYQDTKAPPRNLALFDGLDRVTGATSQSAKLTGFLVPQAAFDAKLGVVTYEGDHSSSGDALLFGLAPLSGADALSDALNPGNNFFNGTRSWLGTALTQVGDLPQVSGAPASLSSFDLDVVDITSRVKAGQTTADIRATSSGDIYYLGGFVTSISTFKPDFGSSTKSVKDLNGGAVLPGDELLFTITVKNNGNDIATDVVLNDILPKGLNYKPSSTSIATGPGAGPKTDAPGDDQATWTASNRTLTVHLGQGATAAQGGSLGMGESTVVEFSATVDAAATGTLNNQASISAAGKQGAKTQSWLTDGNGSSPGSPPTGIIIDLCETDAQCSGATPKCDTQASPNTCVGCLNDGDCSPPNSICLPTLQVCGQCATNNDCPIEKPVCSNTLCVCKATGAEVCGNLIDEDCDGKLDNGCADTDADGLSDTLETKLGTDPNDADSDDDGLLDGDEPKFYDDSDNDGLINALDPDSDNDALFDGTEAGKDCSNPATDPKARACHPDTDAGLTQTDPLNPDSDGGGQGDGSEDANLNGKVDAGEFDPSAGQGADDSSVVDTDKDLLSDTLENFLGTNPNDADSDDDGLLDGDEPNPSHDGDGDGLLTPLDTDSDNDGLFDGTEDGKDCGHKATDVSKKHCTPDQDKGKTKTSALLVDSDGGGVSDGSEDGNLNGALDSGETDPTTGHAKDDTENKDTDGDGLSDALETTLGLDPGDADSDDDGLLDGDEPNPADDQDGDGKLNSLDGDADGDGLPDGLETGRNCKNPATASTGPCIPDSNSSTLTFSLISDSDGGGVSDGKEDLNKNGKLDPGETDPNNPNDDICKSDTDCQGPNSGSVCENGQCVPGCRGIGAGAGCPAGLVCTSTDANLGACTPAGSGGSGAGGMSASGGLGGTESGQDAGRNNASLPRFEGGGCACKLSVREPGGRPLALSCLLLLTLMTRRRRSHQRDRQPGPLGHHRRNS